MREARTRIIFPIRNMSTVPDSACGKRDTNAHRGWRDPARRNYDSSFVLACAGRCRPGFLKTSVRVHRSSSGRTSSAFSIARSMDVGSSVAELALESRGAEIAAPFRPAATPSRATRRSQVWVHAPRTRRSRILTRTGRPRSRRRGCTRFTFSDPGHNCGSHSDVEHRRSDVEANLRGNPVPWETNVTRLR